MDRGLIEVLQLRDKHARAAGGGRDACTRVGARLAKVFAPCTRVGAQLGKVLVTCALARVCVSLLARACACVCVLLRVDVNVWVENGLTPLMLAAKHGGAHAEALMRALIYAGADANELSRNEVTALFLAAGHGGAHFEGMFRVLLDAGANVNAIDQHSRSALMIAAEYGGAHGEAIMRALTDAGANVNKRNFAGVPALWLAADCGGEHAEAMVRLLVARGATLGRRKCGYDTPPAVAAYVHGTENWTPLHRAADARDIDALRECLSSGARPDTAVDSPHPHMRTALSIAGSASYPTARPVDEDCLALLRSAL